MGGEIKKFWISNDAIVEIDSNKILAKIWAKEYFFVNFWPIFHNFRPQILV
jgi:hypothetical protein